MTADFETKLTKSAKDKDKAVEKLTQDHQIELKKQSAKLETLETVAGQAQLKLDATLKQTTNLQKAAAEAKKEAEQAKQQS